MGKFLLGLATGLFLVLLMVVLLFAVAMRYRDKPPEIEDHTVLVLRLSGDIPEKPPVEMPAFVGGDQPGLTMTGLWMVLHKAAVDPHITAIVLQPEHLSAGWAKMQEIRSGIELFRKSGKPVYAYLRTPGGREYYVATAAERIYLGPSDPVFLRGLRVELMYFKNGLDKLGVNVEVEHAGKYKDFGDMFTRTDMSAETHEVIGELVDSFYGHLVRAIATGRKKSEDEVRAIIDRGPFTSKQAEKAGLVDSLRYEDEMWGELRDRLKAGEPHRVSLGDYLKVPADAVGLGGKSKIAMIVADGEIVRGSSGDDGAEEMLTSYGFNKLLRKVRNDSSIQGVVVRINSPGGEETASDDMWREMNLLSKKKPLVISMSDVAASGGYFMAMTGDPIVAYPQTETGSIGVVFGKPNLRGLYDKFGVTKDAVERGKHAGIESDYTPLTPEERQLLRDGIDESYRDFVGKVAVARHRKFEEVEPLAQGRVWLGDQAHARGLVDELGGLDRAIELVKAKAKIPVTEHVNLVMYPGRRSILDLLLQRSVDDPVDTALRRVFGRVPFQAWRQGGMLRVMPQWISVN